MQTFKIFTLSIIALTLISCGGNQEKSKESDNGGNNEVNEVKDGEVKDNSTESNVNLNHEGLVLAYVQSDSIQAKYKYVTDMQNELVLKQEKLQSELKSLYGGYESAVGKYQKDAQLMLQSERQKEEMKLQQMQQSIMQKEQTIQGDYAEFETRMYSEYHRRVAAYVKKYAQENNIDIVVGYQLGANVLYVNQGLNITSDIVKGLNEEYQGL